MEIVKPKIKLLNITPEPLKLIEMAGRICYKSEEKIEEGSDEKFVKMIIDRGHESVLEHASATYLIITDRGVTHELVRHRIASYSQESTRYCNYSKIGIKFIKPDFDLDEEDLQFLSLCEGHYTNKIKKGFSPQQARYFLPGGLKTEIIVTMNFRGWRHFLKLRTQKAAHPQIRQIALMILENLKGNVPVVFNDI